MSHHRYLAERTAEGITLKKLASLVLETLEGVVTIAIAGALDPDDLAREAATTHFQRHPGRTKVFVIATSGPTTWGAKPNT